MTRIFHTNKVEWEFDPKKLLEVQFNWASFVNSISLKVFAMYFMYNHYDLIKVFTNYW